MNWPEEHTLIPDGNTVLDPDASARRLPMRYGTEGAGQKYEESNKS